MGTEITHKTHKHSKHILRVTHIFNLQALELQIIPKPCRHCLDLATALENNGDPKTAGYLRVATHLKLAVQTHVRRVAPTLSPLIQL